MAGPLEDDGVCVGCVDEPIDSEVPGQRVRPLMAEHLDGLRLSHVLVEPGHEPLPSPDACPRIVSGSHDVRITTGMAVGH